MQKAYLSSPKELDEYYLASTFPENLHLYRNCYKTFDNNNELDKTKQQKLLHQIATFPINTIQHYITNPISTNAVLSQKDNFLADLDVEINRAMKRCVEHHLEIIDLLKRYEEIFNILGLIKAVQVSLFMCTVAFSAGTVRIIGLKNWPNFRL